MSVLFQLVICISLITLAGGTISYLHKGATFGGGILLIAIWGIMVGLVAIILDHALDLKKKNLSKSPPSTDRIDTLEKRLTDIQEIAIAMDEKMSRIEEQSESRNKVV